jgi:putative copper resistance protein D
LKLRRNVAGWILSGVAALLLALVLGGGAPHPVPVGLPDAGALVGWAVPVASLSARLAAVGVIGMLIAGVFLLPGRSDVVEGLARKAITNAAWCAWCWSFALLALFVLTMADWLGQPLGAMSLGTAWSFATDTSLGGIIMVEAMSAAVLAVLLRTSISVRVLALLLLASVLALLPRAWTGHAATGAHDLAALSLFVHVVAVAVWVGGLLALVWIALQGSKRLPAAVQRYGTLATWAYATVAVSGAVNLAARVQGWAALLSPYGAIVGAKVVAFVMLGIIGWRARRAAAFAATAAVEVFLMAATMGLAAALSRTPPPPSGRVLDTRAEELLGGAMPPAPTWAHVLWGWQPTGVGLLVISFGATLYLAGLWALRRRGDTWPVGRTIAWFLGLVAVAWASVGGLSVYANVLFSAHMGSHMVLAMVAPILLVLGAPVTLALRTLPGPRQPGELSPRGLLTALLHSKFARFMTFPAVGPALFVGSLFVLYFTDLFGWLMGSMWGHAAMEAHFLAVGALYYYVIIGVDPSPRSLPPIARFGVLMVTIPFHAFFSIALMSASQVIAEPYWRALDRPYDTDLLADQYLGGGISWAMGEVPLVLVLGALFVQWFRSDTRDARRSDRAADRDADAELTAYNAYLQDLADNGRRRQP